MKQETPEGRFFVSLLAVGEAGFEPGSQMPGELASDGALFHLLANCPEGLSCRPSLLTLTFYSTCDIIYVESMPYKQKLKIRKGRYR
jgi:hypothetical protein